MTASPGLTKVGSSEETPADVPPTPGAPAATSAPGGVRRLLRSGRVLPDEQWSQHHHFVLRTLAVLATGIVGYALVRGYGVLGAAGLSAPVLALSLLARLPFLSRGERAATAATGLMTAAAVVVHTSGGQTEAHFLFFALLPLAALYATPTPFVLAVGFVALHHLVLGTLVHGSVFPHHQPALQMALVHAVFVLVESWACFVAWSRFEDRREHVEHLVLERTAQLQEQRDELARLAAAVQSTADAVMTIAPDGVIQTWNRGAERLYGHRAEEIVGRSSGLLLPPDQRHLLDAALAGLASTPELQVERVHQRRDGSLFEALVTVSAIHADDGSLTGYAAIARDVSGRKRAEAEALATARKLREQAGELTRLAHHDPLTGLANRSLLQHRLERARTGRRSAVLLLDLDGFKSVNDVCGHEAGDAVLVEVSRRLEATVRPTDTVARLGGDEFVVLLDDAPGVDTVTDLARRLLAAIVAPVVWGRERFEVGCSIGIAMDAAAYGDDPGELLRDADIAMYAAKAAGRNGYRVFEPGMRAAVVTEQHLVRDLRAGLAAGQLHLVFQPQVDLPSGRVTGVEALTRWQHPERGLIPPADFIAAAERNGLVDELDDWALGEACRQLGAWDAAGVPPLRVGVNVSAGRLARGDLAGTIAACTRAAGVDPSRLEVEVTETGTAGPGAAAGKTLRAVRAMGVTVAIDDFGTGHSSFSRLQALPVDRLKIDRSFVAPLTAGTAHGSIAAAMIALGRSLGLQVVAEGVESRAQLDALAALGCPTAQGYLLGRPVPAAGIPRLVAAAELPVAR